MEVLIVDDDALLREILTAVVAKAWPEARSVAVADLDAAFERLAHYGAPDLALLDLGLPGQAGLDALRRFRRKFPDLAVVVVSANEDPKAIGVALDAGAAGYIPKTLSADVMVAALQLVAGGGTYRPPQAN